MTRTGREGRNQLNKRMREILYAVTGQCPHYFPLPFWTRILCGILLVEEGLLDTPVGVLEAHLDQRTATVPSLRHPYAGRADMASYV